MESRSVFRGLFGAVVSVVGVIAGTAAADTGSGSIPGVTLALYSSSIVTTPIAWSRLLTIPVGPPGTLAGVLQRARADPTVVHPWIRDFQLGDAILMEYDAWKWCWDNEFNNNPCN